MGQGVFSNNGGYYLDVDASLAHQNIALRISTIYWRMKVVRTGPAGGYWSSANMGNTASVDNLWSNNNLAYDFRAGSEWTIAEGYFDVTHRADGTAEYQVNGHINLIYLGSADASTGLRSLPRFGDFPPAPSPITIDSLTMVSMRYLFSSNGDGGLPIREWQIGWGTDPNWPQNYIASSGTTLFTGLQPATRYYFWSRGRNDAGWSAWSSRLSERTPAGARIKVNGEWREAIPYIKVNGIWRLAQPHKKTGGVWKLTG